MKNRHKGIRFADEVYGDRILKGTFIDNVAREYAALADDLAAAVRRVTDRRMLSERRAFALEMEKLK
jgi:hypothetical protein